jgi:hypothetical protein
MVTLDGDFFADKEKTSLHHVLRRECDEAGILLDMHRDLKTVLSRLREQAPDLDYDMIAASIQRSIADDLSRSALKVSLRIADIRERKISAFITENHDVLAIEFDIVFEAIDIGGSSQDEKVDPHAKVSGDGKYVVSTGEVVQHRLQSIEFRWCNTEGHPVESTHLFLYSSDGLQLGETSPDVPYVVRQKIE